MPRKDGERPFALNKKGSIQERLSGDAAPAVGQFLQLHLETPHKYDRSATARVMKRAIALQKKIASRAAGELPKQYLEAIGSLAKEYATNAESFDGADIVGSAAGQAAAAELVDVYAVIKQGRFSKRNIVRTNLRLAVHQNEAIASAPQQTLNRFTVHELWSLMEEKSKQPEDALVLIAPFVVKREPRDSQDAATIARLRASLLKSVKSINVCNFISRYQPRSGQILDALYPDIASEPGVIEQLTKGIQKEMQRLMDFGIDAVEREWRRIQIAADDMPQWAGVLQPLMESYAHRHGFSLESEQNSPIENDRIIDTTRSRKKAQSANAENKEYYAQLYSGYLRYLESVQPIDTPSQDFFSQDPFNPNKWQLFEAGNQTTSYEYMQTYFSLSHKNADTQTEKRLQALWNQRRESLKSHVYKSVSQYMSQVLDVIHQCSTDPNESYQLDELERKWLMAKTMFDYYGGNVAAVEQALSEKRSAITATEQEAHKHELALRSEEEKIQIRMDELITRYADALGIMSVQNAEMRTPLQESGQFASIQLGISQNIEMRQELSLSQSLDIHLHPLADHVTLELGKDDREEIIRFRGETMAWLLPHEFSHEVLNQLQEPNIAENAISQIAKTIDAIDGIEPEHDRIIKHYIREALIDGIGIQLVETYGTPDIIDATPDERRRDMAAAVARFVQVYVQYFEQHVDEDPGNIDHAVGHERMRAVVTLFQADIAGTVLENDFRNAVERLNSISKQQTVLDASTQTQLAHAFAHMHQQGRTLPLNIQ